MGPQPHMQLLVAGANTVVPLLSIGEMFEENQWVPETMDSTKLYIAFFPCRSLKGGTLWPFFGISELPASLFLSFGAVMK